MNSTNFRKAVIATLFLLAAPALIQGGPVFAHEAERTLTRESFAGASEFKPDAAFKYSQAAVGGKLGAHALRDTSGQTVALAEYLGKPLILSFVYSSCHHTCPVITQNLADAVDRARDAIGRDKFHVLTVGFDSLRDTPASMKLFAKQQGIGDARWSVLSGDARTIERLAGDTGFIYFRSPKGFDHLSQTTIIDADGMITAQIYGQAFDPTLLVEQLKQLVFGASATITDWNSLLNRVRLFCTIYDPWQDKYRFDYSFFIGMVLSGLFFLLAGAFLVRDVWRLWRGDSHNPTA